MKLSPLYVIVTVSYILLFGKSRLPGLANLNDVDDDSTKPGVNGYQ